MPINDLCDEEIIERLKTIQSSNGISSTAEQQYMEVLYNRHYSNAYNLSRFYGLKHSDAEDTVQDVFIKLFRTVNGFRSGFKFGPWFYKIILNKVRDKYNYLKKVKYKEIDFISDKIDEGGEIIFEKFQIRECLNGIINKIPVKFKKILLLHVYGGLDIEEIAEIAGISQRQVYNRLNMAFKMLKSQAEGEL